MIVRAATALMPGAQLTPVRRYAGPRRGLHLVRPRRRYGMGEEVGPLTGAGLLARDLQSYTTNLAYSTEQGTAVTPEQLRANLQGDVNAYCGQWPDRCAGGAPNVEAAVAVYASQLGTQVQRVQQGALNNTIALPLPTPYYSSPQFNMLAPPPAPAPPPPPEKVNIQYAPGSKIPFIVPTAAPAPPAKPAAQSNAPAPAQAGSNGAGQSNAAGNTTVVVPGIADMGSWLTRSTLCCGGFFNIPNALVLLGIAGVGYLAFGGNSRR